jgi:hypothetical protein
MHYLAAKQALFALMGGAEGAPPAAPDMGAEAGAPPAPEAAAAAPAPAAPDASMAPPAPAPEAAPEEEQPAMKSEDDETSLVKAELETVKAQMAEMEAVILKMARTPVRKSVIATDYVGKPTETPAVEVPNLTKKEVFDRLAPRMSELSKSDRQLVNQFAFGNVAITEIAHLLKR